jgi:hypothetical protein
MDAEVPARASVVPQIVGILIAGLVVLAIGLWLGRRPVGPAEGLLQIELVRPSAGDTVVGNARIEFRTKARLTKAPEGWRAGRLHLHALVDGVELMPGAADITRIGDGAFVWQLPQLRAGEHEIALRWSAPDHRPVDEGATDIVPFVVSERVR